MSLFDGIIATPMAPFDQKGRVDYALIPDCLAWLHTAGVRGIFCLGTWGGFPLLTKEERLGLAEAYTKAAQDTGLKIILQVGSPCLPDALDFVLQANALDVDATASLVPYYYSGANYFDDNAYRQYFGTLLAKTEQPLFVYNNPRTTGTLLSPNMFATLVSDGLAGVKDGSKQITWPMQAKAALAEQNLDAEIIPGNSSAIIYALTYGLRAVTSGAAMTFPRLAASVVEAWDRGDTAKATRQHELLSRSRDIIAKAGNPAMVSYGLLRRIGPSLGWPRAPWIDIDQAALDRVYRELASDPDLSPYLDEVVQRPISLVL